MTQKNCLPFQAEIEEAASADRVIGSAARQHLANCSACAGSFGEHSRLRELIAGLEPVTAPADFEFRLRARLATALPRRRSAFGGRWSPWSGPALGLASAVVLVVGGIAVSNTGLVHFAGSNGAISAATIRLADSNALDWTGSNSTEMASVPLEASAPDNRLHAIHSNVPKIARTGISSGESSLHNAADPVLPEGFTSGNEMSVSMSSNPSGRITVDQGGKMRNISLRNVSFGSQALTEPAVSRSLPPATERIW